MDRPSNWEYDDSFDDPIYALMERYEEELEEAKDFIIAEFSGDPDEALSIEEIEALAYKRVGILQEWLEAKQNV